MRTRLSHKDQIEDFSRARLVIERFCGANMARFQAATALQHVCLLMSRPDLDEGLSPSQLAAFIEQALAYAKQTKYFIAGWKQLQDYMPEVIAAWKQGQIVFQQDLDRAESDPEDFRYLSQIDFADSCYAYPNGRKLYPESDMLRRWFQCGYMGAWRRHFLAKDEQVLVVFANHRRDHPQI